MTNLNMDTQLTITNIKSIVPFKNGPKNEWFVRTESGLTYALFTPMGYEFKSNRVVYSIEAVVESKFLKGKDRKVYIATAINYEAADAELEDKLLKFKGRDITQLTQSEVVEFLNAKQQKASVAGPSPQKWVDALSFAAININEDLKKVRMAERDGSFSELSRDVDEKYMSIMEESRDTFLASENQLSNWMATSTNIVAADNKNVHRSGYIANSSRSKNHAKNVTWDIKGIQQDW